MGQILIDQLTDPFRIGLLAALVLTTLNTAHHTGRLVPLALGTLFVAFLIPTAFGAGGAGLVPAVATGIVANAVILGIVLGLVYAWSRIAGRK